MSLTETLKREIQTAREILAVPRSELKQRAQSAVEGIYQSAQFRLDAGVITQRELDTLSADPKQEVLYKEVMKAYDKNPDNLSNFLDALSLAQQTDIGLRHAKWLKERFGLE